MKKKLLLLLPIFLLSLSSCNSKRGDNTSIPSEESVSEELPSESEPISEEESSNEEEASESESETESESEVESESESESESGDDSEEEYTYTGLENDPINTDPVAQEYYEDISKTATGSELANQLQTLVNKNRCATGYGSLWSYYPYCDADPDNPTSDKIIAFYRGTPASQNEMNREHVWPNSRGGDLVEGDPHMTRPTLSKDNSSRGNSFYVEGLASPTDGWDPKTDGMNEQYRGDCARIIFYAAIAKYGTLKLVDKTNDSTGNKSMGKLSDLIKWNFEYPVSKYEKLRNEVLSGETSVKGSDYKFNRNPFIDDRTLPCRIWGDTNSETQRLCSMYMNRKAPTAINLNESSIKISAWQTFELKVESVSPADALDSVYWSSLDESIATVDKDGIVTGISDGTTTIVATSTLSSKVTASCTVVVETAEKALDSISVTSSLNLSIGSSNKISVSYDPTNVYPRPELTFTSGDNSIASVDNSGNVTGVSTGTTQITVKAKQNDITKYGYCNVTVSQPSEFQKVTTTPSSWEGRYLIVNEANKKAFNSSASTIASNNALDITITNGKIASTNELLSALVVVERVGDEYIMKTSTGLTIKSGNKTIVAEQGGTTKSTFTLSGDSVTIYSGSNEYKLQYNSGANVFRYYSTSGQQPVTMYKLM